MATQSQLEKEIGELKATLEKFGKPQADPDKYWGGGFNKSQLDERGWPSREKMERVAKAYGDNPIPDGLLRDGHGRLRVTGHGPMLKKMAGLADRSLLDDPNYSAESLEKEFFATSYQKAVQHGVLMPNGQRRKAALGEGAGATGGYIVPPQFQTELLTIAAEDAFIKPRCQILPMTTRTAEWPMLDITTVQSAGTSPYFGGIIGMWQPEAATINETEPTFRSTMWTAWDLVLYTVASNQLLADNGVGLDALLTTLFAQAMTWYEEYAFLQGRGAGNSMPLGILNAGATLLQTRTIPGKITLGDLAAMMAHSQARSWESSCWVAHQSILPQLVQMYANSTSGDRLVWLSPYGDGSTGPAAMKLPTALLNGLPLYFTEKAPQLGSTGDLMLIDWSRYVVGQRMDIQIDVSPHYRFQNNQLAWRVIVRLDGRPWLNSFITDQTGWQISPFIALK